ncbi:amino acid permease-domain-containing protein [Microdochium trichocladiopsis]|uniref:Amino acid permease-domain-containing protein n=1 Tax=Microdochium trichocladiopsis TaxID=1682393 RepID=A0A9P8XTS3_9PEZI|nr:amino acid permease-domain-containing protein [Microdochium trichocladiopsis]KAH7017963.1 amino acid permease-domain-containing protein [Microdochium trichocladiopsis]
MKRGQAAPTGSAHGHLQQRLSVLSTMAMAFAILNTWIALAGSLGLVLPSGGPTALLYGFIICVMCNFALAASLGELAAIWPTAGGQYHFVYALCSEKWAPLLSFFTAWANIFGWLSVVTVQAFFGAQFISAAAIVASYEQYEITAAKTYGIFAALVLFGTSINIWGNKILGFWNDGALYWSIAAVSIISVIVLAMSDKTVASFVFTEFDNSTGWPDGMAWLLGLLQPALDIPRAMLYAVAVGGVTGFAFILVTLFGLTDPATILASTTGIPIVELILQATKSRAAATILNLMMAVCFINGTTASITSASRLVWCMARDRGTFFSEFFTALSPTLNVPVRTILACTVFNLLFGLLYLGPPVAFSAYMSSCTIFLNVSYGVPVIALLARGRAVLAAHRYPGTPHQLGRWGLAVNLVASLYVVVTSVLFMMPTSLPVSGANMNYVIVVIGIFLIYVSIYWVFKGSSFTGPDFDGILGRAVSNVIQASSSNVNEPYLAASEAGTKGGLADGVSKHVV